MTEDEEARWDRVLVQTGYGLATYLAVLVATRLWTSFTFSSFLKRRHKSSLDTVLAVVDILFSLGSQCCFIAYTFVREYNKYISFVELGFAAFYCVSTYRQLWLKHFDFRATMKLSTFLDSFCVACALYQARRSHSTHSHSSR